MSWTLKQIKTQIESHCQQILVRTVIITFFFLTWNWQVKSISNFNQQWQVKNSKQKKLFSQRLFLLCVCVCVCVFNTFLLERPKKCTSPSTLLSTVGMKPKTVEWYFILLQNTHYLSLYFSLTFLFVLSLSLSLSLSLICPSFSLLIFPSNSLFLSLSYMSF